MASNNKSNIKSTKQTIIKWKCSKCEKEILTAHSATISRHKSLCGKKGYLCIHCGTSFKRSDNLRRHLLKCDDLNKETRNSCNICGGTFRGNWEVKRHKIQVHKDIDI